MRRLFARWKGASLLETALAVGIMGMIMGSMAMMQGEQAQRDRAYLAADRLKEIEGWVMHFMETSGSTLTRNLPVGQTVAMSVLSGGPGRDPSLESLGFVPEGYQDRDSWGNKHVILLRQSSPGSVTALVAQVGGKAMSDKDLGNAMLRMGAIGGGVFAVPPPAARDSKGVILGTGGGWKLDIAQWTVDGISVDTGHAVARASLSSGNQVGQHITQTDAVPGDTVLPPLSVPTPDAPQPPVTMDME